MGWLDANEYLVMEMAGRDRIDDITQTALRVQTAGDDHERSDVTPYEMGKEASRLVGRLMCRLGRVFRAGGGLRAWPAPRAYRPDGEFCRAR
jgi:hypothetical protein